MFQTGELEKSSEDRYIGYIGQAVIQAKDALLSLLVPPALNIAESVARDKLVLMQ